MRFVRHQRLLLNTIEKVILGKNDLLVFDPTVFIFTQEVLTFSPDKYMLFSNLSLTWHRTTHIGHPLRIELTTQL